MEGGKRRKASDPDPSEDEDDEAPDECSICLEELDPKTVVFLPCDHRFCRECLDDLAVSLCSSAAPSRTSRRGVRIDCPNCRRPTRWASSGMGGATVDSGSDDEDE